MEDYNEMCKCKYHTNLNKALSKAPSKTQVCPNKSIQVNFYGNKYTENRSTNDTVQCIEKVTNSPSETYILNRNMCEYALKPNVVFSNKSIKSLTSCYIINENTDHLNEIKANKFQHTASLSKNERISNDLTSSEKMFADKATYCRPVLNFYNEQFIFKTMERNARLKNLVRKLVIHRQHERENVTWNNFINELKNKHAVLNNPGHSYLIHDEVHENINPELINDFYNTKFSWQQSKPCENLLQDFYGSFNTHQPNLAKDNRPEFNNNSQLSRNYKLAQYGKSSLCYPNSSQGRLIMMDREKKKTHNSPFWGKHVSDKNLYKTNDKYLIDKTNNDNNFKRKIIRNFAAQTDVEVSRDFFKKKDKATSNNLKFNKITLKEIQQESDKILKRISLVNIESKLETLIESINNFIEELRFNNKYFRINNQDFENYEINNIYNEKNINLKKLAVRESFTFPSLNKIVHEVNNGSSRSSLHLCNLNKNCCQVSTIDDILRETDVNKLSLDNTLKSYPNKPCSVNITFEVPTKDCSTEVTKSLSRQEKGEVFNNIDSSINKVPFEQNMTIAVNTDPLSLLALFRISTDTLKNILSYMPNFNYYSYLSLLPIPRSITHSESHYVCNICGADFCTPSELSEHIPEHNLGKARDCCVCRHVLNSTRRPPALFRCRYCGQCFTRAYCCELHQKSCAKELGRNHDVSSNLMLLR